VNALLGTVNTLLAIVSSHSPRAVVACTGAEEASYRTALYPAYHAHRDPMPAALAAQWTIAPALLAALGWQVSGSDQLEADDVMFSHALVEAEAGGTALLVTGDRDLFGAVGERVAVLALGHGGATEEIGPEQVRQRYGIGPELVADFIALRGDPSDGLPGARGVGAKTAAALLRQHGSLEAVLAAADAAGSGPGSADQMRPRTAAALTESAELLRRFKQIATLQQIVVSRAPDGATDYARGSEYAGGLGMRGLAERLALGAEQR
jgi:DNA polymerase-1